MWPYSKTRDYGHIDTALCMKNKLTGDNRTKKAQKNILASVVLKAIDGIVYLLLVPATLGYLNEYEYGIWLTLSSILMWIDSFDIGLGNGMRNKLAIAMAKGDTELGKHYVSTTFFMLIILMLSIILIGTLIEPFLDWYSILNASIDSVSHLNQIVYLSFSIFCLNFIFKIIGCVFLAMQLPAINNLLTVSGHLLSLIIIYILTITTNGSLLLVALSYSASPLIIYLISYPLTFYKIYPFLKPSYRYFRNEYLKDLFNLGIQFFLLQLSAILLFSFANLLISHMFGPASVTPYNIAYRYFSLIPMGMNLILAPMWSATTDAYARGETDWIQKTMKAIQKILLIVGVGLVLMILISEHVYQIWVGAEVKIPFALSAIMGVYVFIIVCSLTYSNFLNGLGKLKIQTINTVTVALLFLPLCYLLGSKWGIIGVVSGMCLLNLSGLVLNVIQFYIVINNKAKGIWNK